MTSRERFSRCMSYQPMDRIPVLVLEPWENDGLARWRTEGLPADADPVVFLGMDPIEKFWFHCGPIPGFDRRVLHEDEKEIVETDGLGTTVRRLKSNPSMYYGHIDHPVKTMADWLQYKKRLDPHSPERINPHTDAWVQRLNASPNIVGMDLYPWFFRMGFYLMGMERFLTAFYDTPELIHDFFAHWSWFFSEQLKRILPRLKLDFVSFAEDLAYTAAPHISPNIYRDFWLPYQTPIIRQLQSAGVPLIVEYTAGNIDCLLPLMLDSGINCTWTCEQQANMDPMRLRKKFGKSLRLGGGFAKQAIINGPAAIDQMTDHLLPAMRDGGFVPAVDDMVPPEVSFENYRYYAEAMKKAAR